MPSSSLPLHQYYAHIVSSSIIPLGWYDIKGLLVLRIGWMIYITAWLGRAFSYICIQGYGSYI